MEIALQLSFLPLFLIIISNGSTTRFSLTHDQRYLETFLNNISVLSTIECAIQCHETSLCTGFSYNNIGEICLIHSTDINTSQMSMQTDSNWGIYEPGKWIMYVCAQMITVYFLNNLSTLYFDTMTIWKVNYVWIPIRLFYIVLFSKVK